MLDICKYINMVLGKVQMCERYDQLKNYSIAITKECMRYQNHVASAIKPSVFETPFIGKNAFRVQLLQAETHRKRLSEEIDVCREKQKNLDFVLHPLTTEHDVDIKYRLDVLSDLRNLQNAVLKCKTNIDTLKKNATMIQKQIQLDALGALIKELDSNIGKLNKEMGHLEEKIRSRKEQQENCRLRQIEQQSLLGRLTGEAGERFPAWKQEYDKLTEQRVLIQFRDNFDRRRKANRTTTDEAETEMTNDCSGRGGKNIAYRRIAAGHWGVGRRCF